MGEVASGNAAKPKTNADDNDNEPAEEVSLIGARKKRKTPMGTRGAQPKVVDLTTDMDEKDDRKESKTETKTENKADGKGPISIDLSDDASPADVAAGDNAAS